MLNRIDEINEVVDNPKLEQARQKLESAISLDPQEADPEIVKKADDKIHEVRNLFYQIRKEHLKEIRQIDLDGVVSLVLRQEQHPTPLPGTLKALHGDLVFDTRDNDLTVGGLLGFVHGEQIAVQYAGVDHAVAADAQ